MTTRCKITGLQAVRIAERDGVTLRTCAHSTDERLTLIEARSWCACDQSLVYCIVQPVGWTGEAGGRNVMDYFRGALDGAAMSGATYLGPDCDGVEPTWQDAQ